MLFQPTSSAVTLFCNAMLSALLCWLAWSRRSAPGAISLSIIMAAVACWSLGYMLEIMADSLEMKLVFAMLQYVGIASLPSVWFVFAVQYTYTSHRLKRLLPWLVIPPILTLVFVFSNQLHGLIWEDVALQRDGLNSPLVVTHGMWFWIHSVYSYTLLLMGTLLLLHSLRRRQSASRFQDAALILAVAAPWLGNIVYLLGLSPLTGLDITPFAFMFTGVMLSIGVVNFRLFDIVPLARAQALASMRDGIIVLDAHMRLVDINTAATTILGCTAPPPWGRGAGAFLDSQLITLLTTAARQPISKTVHLDRDDGTRMVDVHISLLSAPDGEASGWLLTLRDVTEVYRAEEMRQRLTALIEYSTDFIGLADLTGAILFINQAGCQLIGLPDMMAAQSRLMYDVIDPNDMQRFRTTIVPTVLHEGVWNGVIHFRHLEHDRRIPMQFSVFLVRDPHTSAPLAFATVSRDITRERDLEQLREKLTQTMVHDLRNPLTAVRGALDIIHMHGEFSGDMQELVAIARQSSRRMLDLVNSILDISRLEHGSMPVRYSAIAPLDLTVDIAAMLKPLSDAKQQRIVIGIPDDTPTIWADVDLTRRVLQNLIGNAIKFTPDNGVIVISAAAQCQNAGTLQLSVQDSGPGIPHGFRSRLFHQFAVGAMTQGGSGLGLAFCKLAVEAHGGQIWADEDTTTGARFHFTLPTQPPAHG